MAESSTDPEPTPTDLSRWGPLIGVVASFGLCAQNAGFGTGVGWALIHGAGPRAVVAFLPLALGLGLLWAGFVFLRRGQGRQELALFVGLSMALLVLNEWLLPTTPLKAWSSERALKSTQVLSIRDEGVTTATGEPIGLRLVFEVRFPRRVVANISASDFAPSEKEPPWLPGLLDFQGYEQTIQPLPESQDIYKMFEKDVVYRVEIIRRPGFRAVDVRTGRPCRNTPPKLSDKEILTALHRRGNRHYRAEIHVSSDDVPVNIVVAEYQTSRPYDLEAMYRSVMQERLDPCPR